MILQAPLLNKKLVPVYLYIPIGFMYIYQNLVDVYGTLR